VRIESGHIYRMGPSATFVARRTGSCGLSSCGDPAFAARLYRAIAGFLSVRMRSIVQRLGYDKAVVASEDKLDMSLLARRPLIAAFPSPS
jgi:hypothetical protein